MADGWTCTHISGGISSCSLICGDGRVIFPEICDDGPSDHLAPFSIKRCFPNCTGSDPKWNCTNGTVFSPSICTPICGDGFKVGNESCDAG